MATPFCTRCGAALGDGAAFCSRCGSAVGGAAGTAVTPQSSPPARDLPPQVPLLPRRRWRGVAAVVVAITVILVLVAVYVFGFYLPGKNTVNIGGGTFIVNGASSALGVNVGCPDCGGVIPPGSVITIHVNVAVSGQGCSYFCGGYTVSSFSVTAPYVLDSVIPANLPYNEAQGSFNTWALTVTVPSTSGQYGLGGVVAVSYY